MSDGLSRVQFTLGGPGSLRVEHCMSFYVGLPTDKPLISAPDVQISSCGMLTARQNRRDPLKFWEASLAV